MLCPNRFANFYSSLFYLSWLTIAFLLINQVDRQQTELRSQESVDIASTYKLYDSGQYAKCIQACDVGIENAWRVDWRLLKIKSQIQLGKYKEALESSKQALQRHTGDIRVRWVARDAYRLNNDLKNAELMIVQIDKLVKDSPWRYSDAEDRIVLGNMMLEVNADAKKVLELFFDTAKKVQPALVDNYIVAADLALSKTDFGLAAKEASDGLKRHAENAELHYRLARALWDSDREKGVQALTKTLTLNPNHFEAILFQADHAIDREDYDAAKKFIRKVLQINPRHQLALAHEAIIAHLLGDYTAEKEFREKALASWSKNPWVDFTIGRKLSQKYRFREGADYQKSSLKMNPDFVPSKIQLAQDLLRLGEDEQGWALVSEANQLDEYNVLMHNLQTLHDEISSFSSLEKDGIIVRMSSQEARLYGPDVLELLLDAKQKLTAKYEYQFDRPVIVEIFPRQQDFAIRTFGMPGGAGFLGVCFGHLITANSPASQTDTPTNWKSVLWHEFCHAVTLGKTKNRMPRWLSEGISVYEERLRNPGSGEKISPTYRRMMLSEDLTPVSQLSAAFLQAKSSMHLQFAYFESSLVIEYLIEKHGMETLKKILVDLGAGISINEALQRYTGSLAELDQAFKKYATELANGYASELEFSDSGLPPTATVSQIQTFLTKSPKNFAANLQLAAVLIRKESFGEAKSVLETLAQKFDDKSVHPVILDLLVAVYRGLKDEDSELKTLESYLAVGDDHLDAYRRLAEIYQGRADWEKVRGIVERMLAVNPLRVEPYRWLATAGENLQDEGVTSRALECLLEFETTDLAQTHYRIAKIKLRQNQISAAKRHVLLALEEAPRFRDALKLLIKIRAEEGGTAE